MDFGKGIEQLKRIFSIKDDLNERDLIILAMPDMTLYGFVHKIERDKAAKVGTWWHVTFTILSVPPVTTTLIMRTEQMTGRETFTVGGKNRFFAPIDPDALYTDPTPVVEPPKRPKLVSVKRKEQVK